MKQKTEGNTKSQHLTLRLLWKKMEETNDSFLSANSKEKIKWICTAWDRWIWSEKEGDPEFLGMTLDTIFVTIFSKRMDLSPNSKDGTFPVPP